MHRYWVYTIFQHYFDTLCPLFIFYPPYLLYFTPQNSFFQLLPQNTHQYSRTSPSLPYIDAHTYPSKTFKQQTSFPDPLSVLNMGPQEYMSQARLSASLPTQPPTSPLHPLPLALLYFFLFPTSLQTIQDLYHLHIPSTTHQARRKRAKKPQGEKKCARNSNPTPYLLSPPLHARPSS